MQAGRKRDYKVSFPLWVSSDFSSRTILLSHAFLKGEIDSWGGGGAKILSDMTKACGPPKLPAKILCLSIYFFSLEGI